MRNQPDFTDRFRNTLESARPSANIDRIERRVCASDDFDGVEYEVYGWHVPIRPILDTVREMDDFAIESISYINEGDEPKLNFFLVDLRRTHEDAAFTQTP